MVGFFFYQAGSFLSRCTTIRNGTTLNLHRCVPGSSRGNRSCIASNGGGRGFASIMQPSVLHRYCHALFSKSCITKPDLPVHLLCKCKPLSAFVVLNRKGENRATITMQTARHRPGQTSPFGRNCHGKKRKEKKGRKKNH
jgi:hypothetical protein